MRFIRVLIANRPDIKAANTPIIMTPVEISPVPNLNTSLNSNTAAPKIEGIEIRKENLVANSLLNPLNKDPTIVEPDLDIPGVMAKP